MVSSASGSVHGVISNATDLTCLYFTVRDYSINRPMCDVIIKGIGMTCLLGGKGEGGLLCVIAPSAGLCAT